MALSTAVLSNWLTRVNDHRCLVAHLLQAPSSANCVWGLRIVGADFDDRKRSTTEPPLKTMKHHAPPLFFLLSLSSLYPYRVLSASPRPSDISTPLAACVAYTKGTCQVESCANLNSLGSEGGDPKASETMKCLQPQPSLMCEKQKQKNTHSGAATVHHAA